jgi:catechol 2,3-dioxygenase-like lactoylglutathione lyase family enzyme
VSVTDIEASLHFYKKLGLDFYTNEDFLCFENYPSVNFGLHLTQASKVNRGNARGSFCFGCAAENDIDLAAQNI